MGATQLQRFDAARLPELMRWFHDTDACRSPVLASTTCARAAVTSAVSPYSLFVLPGNGRAMHLYQRLGFEPACYPEPDPVFDDCIYMVAASLRT